MPVCMAGRRGQSLRANKASCSNQLFVLKRQDRRGPRGLRDFLPLSTLQHLLGVEAGQPGREEQSRQPCPLVSAHIVVMPHGFVRSWVRIGQQEAQNAGPPSLQAPHRDLRHPCVCAFTQSANICLQFATGQAQHYRWGHNVSNAAAQEPKD